MVWKIFFLAKSWHRQDYQNVYYHQQNYQDAIFLPNGSYTLLVISIEVIFCNPYPDHMGDTDQHQTFEAPVGEDNSQLEVMLW